jgi:hypothetical protein
VSRTDGSAPVGSAAEEAAKLFGTLSGRAGEHGEGISTIVGSMAGSVGHGLREQLGARSAENARSPLFQTMTAIRQTSPEVRAHLAEAASSLMLAAAGMSAPNVPLREAGVERIDLDDDMDWREDLS